MLLRILIILSPLLLAFQLKPHLQHSSSQPASAKIMFDISKISVEGLMGEPGSLRSFSYEFCIPANAKYLAEVKSIDAAIAVYPHSQGRIGCKHTQYLCIGNTHNSHWQEILHTIANLNYVERIDEFFGE